jgi:TonB family protein
MKINSAVLLLAVLLVAQSRASSEAASRGTGLIELASAKMNIFELPSFRMEANLRIDNFGKSLDGTYSLLWNGPEQWREEITLPGYSEVEVGSKDMLYLKRSMAYMPYRVFQLHSTLGFGSIGLPRSSFFNQGPQADEAIKAVHEKKLAGEKAECLEIRMESGHTREVCVDSKTGALNRAAQHLLDSDFSPVGEKIFPRSLVLEQDGKRVVEVHVTELKSGEQLQSSLFEPPQSSVSRHGCMNPTPGHKIKEVVPVYPFEDKRFRNQGTVGVYAILDESGTPQDFQKVLTASPGLDKSTIDAIGKWRYAPARCNGTPVAVETVIEVNYTLQY